MKPFARGAMYDVTPISGLAQAHVIAAGDPRGKQIKQAISTARKTWLGLLAGWRSRPGEMSSNNFLIA